MSSMCKIEASNTEFDNPFWTFSDNLITLSKDKKLRVVFECEKSPAELQLEEHTEGITLFKKDLQLLQTTERQLRAQNGLSTPKALTLFQEYSDQSNAGLSFNQAAFEKKAAEADASESQVQNLLKYQHRNQVAQKDLVVGINFGFESILALYSQNDDSMDAADLQEYVDTTQFNLEHFTALRDTIEETIADLTTQYNQSVDRQRRVKLHDSVSKQNAEVRIAHANVMQAMMQRKERLEFEAAKKAKEEMLLQLQKEAEEKRAAAERKAQMQIQLLAEAKKKQEAFEAGQVEETKQNKQALNAEISGLGDRLGKNEDAEQAAAALSRSIALASALNQELEALAPQNDRYNQLLAAVAPFKTV